MRFGRERRGNPEHSWLAKSQFCVRCQPVIGGRLYRVAEPVGGLQRLWELANNTGGGAGMRRMAQVVHVAVQKAWLDCLKVVRSDLRKLNLSSTQRKKVSDKLARLLTIVENEQAGSYIFYTPQFKTGRPRGGGIYSRFKERECEGPK